MNKTKNIGISRALEYSPNPSKLLSPKLHYLAGYNQATSDLSNNIEADAINDVLKTEILIMNEAKEEMLEVLKTMVSDFENTSESSSDILIETLNKAKKIINSSTTIQGPVLLESLNIGDHFKFNPSFSGVFKVLSMKDPNWVDVVRIDSGRLTGSFPWKKVYPVKEEAIINKNK